jgi:hypothetical protein
MKAITTILYASTYYFYIVSTILPKYLNFLSFKQYHFYSLGLSLSILFSSLSTSSSSSYNALPSIYSCFASHLYLVIL